MGLNFRELLFLTILLKKVRKYTVEAGDGAKCQNFRWNIFVDGIEVTKIVKI